MPVFGLAFLGSVAGLLGGLILLANKKLGSFLSVHAVAFVAGVLLSVTILDLFPESIELLGQDTALLAILLVVVASFFLEQIVVHFHHHEEHGHTDIKSAIPLVMFGDSLHNFLDGVTIAAAFLVEPRLGFLVALATFLHELPQEIGDFGILLAAGWKKGKIVMFNLLTALATFVGAGATLVFANIASGLSNLLVAVAAGLFLYIAAADFLPKIGQRSKDPSWHQSLLFLSGVLIMIVITKAIPD